MVEWMHPPYTVWKDEEYPVTTICSTAIQSCVLLFELEYQAME